MDHGPKFKAKSINILEENIGWNTSDHGSGRYFFYMIPKTWSIKEKDNRLYYIKIKNLFFSKDFVKKKTNHTLGKYICKTHIW